MPLVPLLWYFATCGCHSQINSITSVGSPVLEEAELGAPPPVDEAEAASCRGSWPGEQTCSHPCPILLTVVLCT